MRLAWSEDALRDRRELVLYLAERDISAALRIDDRIVEVLAILDTYPFAGRNGRLRGTRELVITDTPFIGIYRMEDGRPVVLRILHAARDWPPQEP